MNSHENLRLAIQRPAYLLRIIRNQAVTSFEQLVDLFGSEGRAGDFYLYRPLESLHSAELIEWDAKNGTIKLTPLSQRVLSTLNVSLSELANRTDESVTVNPIFGPAPAGPNSTDVFVLMPFSSELKAVYEDHLKKVCVECSLTVARADDFFSTNFIMGDIWQGILNAKVIIADCTGRNPNVFYELGIAHTIGKPTILLAQNETDIPFDIGHRRYLKYGFTPRGMQQLEATLSATLREIVGTN